MHLSNYYNMNITILDSNEFTFLANATKQSKERIAGLLINSLVKNGVMYVDESICGYSVDEILQGEGIETFDISNWVFDQFNGPAYNKALRSLVFFGDGENSCDYCGIETVIHEMAVISKSFSYDNPPEEQILWEERYCANEYCKSKINH